MIVVGSLKDSRRESHGSVAQPISEQDLVKALTEHAHKIATSVLNRTGTGQDLVNDAQVCPTYWETCLKFSKQFAVKCVLLNLKKYFIIVCVRVYSCVHACVRASACACV